MLACARIGAIHSVVFGGFSAESLRDRILDAQAQGARHRGRRLPARGPRSRSSTTPTTPLRETPSHPARRRREARRFPAPREGGARPLVPPISCRTRAAWCEPEAMDAERSALHPLHVGHDGKPKGIIHGTGGYLTGGLRDDASGSST